MDFISTVSLALLAGVKMFEGHWCPSRWLSDYQNKEPQEIEISLGFHAEEGKGQSLGQPKEERVFQKDMSHICDNLSDHLVAETEA